ncbi:MULTISPECIES: ABC transporter ATP-binding protein [Roseobacter]|uniref:ABC transporter ATP-binding protein n=1 Tax=Roseobacter TaxID=2433 RepID=UPI001BC37697|nr:MULTISPECIES: oligopeptide/dipeptide ABC transporter ATP-binding protein [Roseobacter]GIT86035.1 ABC transporter ATP-binding protein [Roseobacter sp. OBYS 0001]
MSNLLEVRNLSKVFTSPGGPFRKARAMHAVNDVSFDLPKGRVIGVVGESGCGKSTLARLILRLIEPSSGTLRFDGDDLLAKTSAEMRKLRADMQMVFQDPYSAIDPRYTVARAVMEPFDVQGREHAGTRESVIAELLEMVGMNAGLAGSFPHQISGGQKQRVGIARALALRPSLLVLDEPTASLDVSVQAQIISLLEQLRDDLGLTYLFISHDLSLVRYFCDEIMVMYLGRVVEALPDTDQPARHPYTKTLMDSTFAPTPNQRRVITPLEGEVPSPFDLPPGCAFVDRCPHATAICTSETPVLSARGGHAVACHNPL